MDKQKCLWRIVFWLAASLFFLLNILTIHDGHNWGDDFGQYIQHGKNIIYGRPYASHIMVEPWVVVPPGFPVVLAPFIKIFGINFKILKLLNVAAWQGFVWVFYPILRRRLGEEAALLSALVLLSSPYFFIFKQNVLSDVVFVFFISLAMLALTKYNEFSKAGKARPANFSLGAALFFMLYSFLIRSAGIFLFIAAAFYILLKSKDKKPVLLIFLMFLIGVSVDSWVGVSGVGHYIESVRSPPGEWAVFAYRHVSHVFHSLAALYIPMQTVISAPIFSVLSFLITKTLPFLLAGVCIIFIYRAAKRTISLLECFFFIYLFGIIIWVIEGGPRYLFPVLGPFLVLGIESFRAVYHFFFRGRFEKIREGAIRWLLILLIANNAVSILINLNFNDDEIFRPHVRAMLRWVKENVQPQERYMFWKPRAVVALTDRVGTPFWIYPGEEKVWLQRVRKFKIDYLIIAKNDPLIQQVSAGAVPAGEVWENSHYKIFKIQR